MSLCEDKRILQWVLNAGSIIVTIHAFGQNLFSLDCTRMHEFENFARFFHETLT
jgi:hypothetical protein